MDENWFVRSFTGSFRIGSIGWQIFALIIITAVLCIHFLVPFPDENQKTQILHGSVSVPPFDQSGSSAVQSLAVKFAKAYQVPPVVLCNVVQDELNKDTHMYGCQVNEVSTEAVKFYIFRPDGPPFDFRDTSPNLYYTIMGS